MRSHLYNESPVQCDLIRHLLRKCHLPQRGRLWEPHGNRPPSPEGKALGTARQQATFPRGEGFGNRTATGHLPQRGRLWEPRGNRLPSSGGKALGTARQQATFRRGEGYYGFCNDAPATAPSSGGLPGRHSRPHRETRFARGMSMAAWKAAATGLTISSIADPYPWLEAAATGLTISSVADFFPWLEAAATGLTISSVADFFPWLEAAATGLTISSIADPYPWLEAAATGLTISSIADFSPWLEGRPYSLCRIHTPMPLSAAGNTRRCVSPRQTDCLLFLFPVPCYLFFTHNFR